MKVAVVQHPPVYLNLNASVAKAVDLIADAGSQGAGEAGERRSSHRRAHLRCARTGCWWRMP